MTMSGMASGSLTHNSRSLRRTMLNAQWNLNKTTKMMAFREVIAKASARPTKKIKISGRSNQQSKQRSIRKVRKASLATMW